jgi:enterochelin esterase-like enzyme
VRYSVDTRSTGRHNPLKGCQGISETLKANGIKHEFVLNPGYRHEWRLWRQHLWDFAPLLFR